MVLWLILSLLCLMPLGFWWVTVCCSQLATGLREDHRTMREELDAVHDRISALNESIAVEVQARSAPKLPEYQTGMWLPTDEQNAETERILRKNEDHALYAPDQRPRSSRPSRPSGPISGRKS